ncbi:MAG TPA: HAMP domain-containing histidine kinase [bacterium]|nr:HAMP domain-containing histidine kinase [bacterium]
MDRPLRIAVVGAPDDRLVGDLRQLPLQPEVKALASLVGDTEALMRLQPDLLLAWLPEPPDEDVGALRLLQRLWPALAVALVGPSDKEVVLAPIARRLSARVLTYPDAPGQLAAAIEQLLHGGDRPPPELFVDLAHGLADEINNPLLFVSGHLQLLRATFDAATERDRRDQIDAALAGLQRIQTSVDRLRLLSQAAGGPAHREPVDLGELLTQAIAQRAAHAPAATVALPNGTHAVSGDRDQLALAAAAMVQFADELAALTDDCHLHLEPVGDALRVRIRARGQALAGWRLPHTFEPFYPQRLLRGQSHGLGLFLAQTIVLGHRGQATARRLPGGDLQVEFVLPG